MLKIALLIPTLDRSGAEKQFSLLASRLPKDEFDVHAIALTRGGPYESMLHEAGVPLTILGKRWKFDPVALWRLRNLIQQLQPDILHSWLFAGNSYARAIAGGRGKPKVIVSERCVDSWKAGWQLAVDRRQIARTTKLVANSQAVADFYQRQGFPAEKIRVIPNGIALPHYPHLDRAAVLTGFDIPANARIVGYVGRLAPQKRVRDLVWAMQLLRQLTENVYFLVVGDGPERLRLEKLARHMGCDHLVRFAGHRPDAAQLIRVMNVLWLASDFEGMSNSVMEAMAAGVPVVASDIPPNRELVVDGETGFIVKVGDSVAFAQFADRLLADPLMSDRMGQAARERIEREFSIEKMVESHASVYREVAEAS